MLPLQRAAPHYATASLIPYLDRQQPCKAEKSIGENKAIWSQDDSSEHWSGVWYNSYPLLALHMVVIDTCTGREVCFINHQLRPDNTSRLLRSTLIRSEKNAVLVSRHTACCPGPANRRWTQMHKAAVQFFPAAEDTHQGPCVLYVEVPDSATDVYGSDDADCYYVSKATRSHSLSRPLLISASTPPVVYVTANAVTTITVTRPALLSTNVRIPSLQRRRSPIRLRRFSHPSSSKQVISSRHCAPASRQHHHAPPPPSSSAAQQHSHLQLPPRPSHLSPTKHPSAQRPLPPQHPDHAPHLPNAAALTSARQTTGTSAWSAPRAGSDVSTDRR
jgi:hypothetical protein